MMLRNRMLIGFAALLALLLVRSSSNELVAAATTASAPSVRDVQWQKHADESAIVEVALPDSAKATALKVTLPQSGGTVRALDLPNPKITASSWAIAGQVKYENVRGNGYLEMWSHFPDGSAYFSRTLDTSGPMGVLHGKSEWREFKLPFVCEPGKTPSRLEVNVVLPEGGTVWLGAAKLKQVIAQPPPAAGAINKATGGAVAAPWWEDVQGGRIGAILGTALGIYGGVVGILCSRGRARRFVISLMLAVLVTCSLLLVVGVIALAIGQPYAVWYPLALCGGIGAAVSAAMLPVVKRRLEEAEMRRMTALDA